MKLWRHCYKLEFAGSSDRKVCVPNHWQPISALMLSLWAARLFKLAVPTAGAALNPVNTANPGNPTPSTGLCQSRPSDDPLQMELEASLRKYKKVMPFLHGSWLYKSPISESVTAWLFSDVTKDSVLKAVEEYRTLEQNAFLEKYGFGKSTRYLLRVDGEDFDSKAIVGAAHGYALPEAGPLENSAFSGGKDAAAGVLEGLGFQIIEKEVTTKRFWTLDELSLVQREHYEVSRSFGDEFTRAEFDERYRKMFPHRNPNSILPSDFSHNNTQRAKHVYPSFLETVGDSVYNFVGLEEGHEAKIRNPLWTRDELILATEFYKKFAPQIPGKTDERLIGLADEIRSLAASLWLHGDETFRNPNGVYMKLMELKKYDPENVGKGLGRKARAVEQEVWDLSSAELAKAARSIREVLKSLEFGNTPWQALQILRNRRWLRRLKGGWLPGSTVTVSAIQRLPKVRRGSS